MNKRLSLWASPLFLLASCGTTLADVDLDLALTPYLGIDAQMRHMGFDKNFGGNVLKKRQPQGNVFLGLKYRECVAVEFGYEFTRTQRRARRYDVGNSVFGQTFLPVPLGFSSTQESHVSSKLYGWNINLVGFFPILCGENNLQLVGSIGMARLKSKTRDAFISTVTEPDRFSDPLIFPNATQTITDFDRFHYKRRKTVLRLGTGLQHMMSDCLGIRALINWEHTDKIKARGRNVTTHMVSPRKTKLKNSVNYGIGIFIPI